MRFRAVILALSRALFGTDLPLPDFPRVKSLRGIGISDSDVYCDFLLDRFSYINTFYHKEPRFDLLKPDVRELGRYDFVICSDVMEHVPAPVHGAFTTLFSLLNATGVLILTVPFRVQSSTVEHIPSLHDFGMVELGGKLVVVSKSAEGSYQVLDDVVLHGGEGLTLEMRVFSDQDLRQRLVEAGFSDISFDASGSAKFGVVFPGTWSLPITAGKGNFRLSRDATRELTEQLLDLKKILKATRESKWMRLGRAVGLGPNPWRSS